MSARGERVGDGAVHTGRSRMEAGVGPAAPPAL